MGKIMKAYDGMDEKPINEVIRLLEVSTSTAVRALKKLVKSNLLKQNGKARSTNYTIIK